MNELPILNEDPNGNPFGTNGPPGSIYPARVRITVPTQGDTIDVIAYPTETPGLVVNRGLEPNGDVWSVTHVRTGRSLPQDYEDYATAQRLATALGEVGDWTQPTLSEQHLEDTRRVLREFRATVCDSCGGSGEAWQPNIDCGDCEGGIRVAEQVP
jgi:hypothetical protein